MSRASALGHLIIDHRSMSGVSGSHQLQAGFTVIELITVMLLIGLLSAIATPLVFDDRSFNARGLQDETLSLLRYAQKTAIAQRRVVCLAFTPRSASLHFSAAPAQASCDTPLRGPTGDVPGTVTAKAGAFYVTQPADFNFNGLGQPVDASGTVLPTQTLQINAMSSAITVETVTGYVHQ